MLPIAAAMAAVAATEYGDAWLVADDHSTAHVAPGGAVHPTQGWATTAARIITRSLTRP